MRAGARAAKATGDKASIEAFALSELYPRGGGGGGDKTDPKPTT